MNILIKSLFGLILFCLVLAIIENIKIRLNESIKKLEGKVLSRRVENNYFKISYFVTFEFYNKSRREFSISSTYYSLLCEGDVGIIKFKGKNFISFIRK